MIAPSPSSLASVVLRVSLGSLVALGALVACDGRPRSTAAASTPKEPRVGPSLAVLDLTGGVPEEEQANFLGVAPRMQSFDDLVLEIDRIGKDKRVKGVFVRLGSTSIGMARAIEIGELLERVGKGGKPVVCHADGYTNATLYAAARGCSKLYVSPAGEVEAIGLAAQVLYMRRLLAENLRLSIDILQVGKFKGAEEPLTRDGPSDEARASLEGTLADIRASWLDGIKKARALPDAEVAEDGPYSPARAKEKGLIDEIGYFDDAREGAQKACGAVRDEVRFGPSAGASGGSDDLGDFVRALTGDTTAPIALVRATGSIAMSGGGMFGGGGGITEKDLSRTLARIEKDDDIKVVVLRIDSPGGSALASDLIWHRLMKLRAKKPIVVSIGDMAASGGYYLASAGSWIMASPASIVGSIGVVGGKISGGKALETLGVHAETFPAKKGDPKAGARAAYLSIVTEWDDATRERVRESMTGIYRLFLDRLAEGRKKPVSAIEPFAEGRIFSGREGLAHGLVDELGGLAAAIAKARSMAGLEDTARLAVFGGKTTLLDSLLGGGDGGGEDRAVAPPGAGVPRLLDVLQELFPELAPFAGSLLPLVRGERALTALPFSIVVR